MNASTYIIQQEISTLRGIPCTRLQDIAYLSVLMPPSPPLNAHTIISADIRHASCEVCNYHPLLLAT